MVKILSIQPLIDSEIFSTMKLCGGVTPA